MIRPRVFPDRASTAPRGHAGCHNDLSVRQRGPQRIHLGERPVARRVGAPGIGLTFSDMVDASRGPTHPVLADSRWPARQRVNCRGG